MTQLIYDRCVFPTHNVCTGADLSQLHPNNQLLYNDWLHQLVRGKTWFGLNYDWPSNFPTSPLAIPEGYDTYVISWHLEPWDFDWIENFCTIHRNQQLIIIGEFDYQSPYDNCKAIKYHCWDLFVPYVLFTFGKSHNFNNKKLYRLSSLVNKPNFTKTLVSSLLHKHYNQNKNLLMSWNVNVRGENCQSMNFLNQIEGRPKLNDLAQYYYSVMKNNTIIIDQFEDNPNLHCNFDHCAYNDCLINLTNETFVQSLKHQQKFPGPYLSEKSWKPLLAGTALLPAGQENTYQYLEKFGFKFNYPWCFDFDKTSGDLDRIEKLTDVIDWIMSTDQILNYEQEILENNFFNYEHIRSNEFLTIIKQINQKSLQNFFATY